MLGRLVDWVSVAAKAREQGVKVRLSVYEGMFHVFQMAYLNIPESKKAWAEAGKFIDVLRTDSRLKKLLQKWRGIFLHIA
jgi:acetyl esterase/lipase